MISRELIDALEVDENNEARKEALRVKGEWDSVALLEKQRREAVRFELRRDMGLRRTATVSAWQAAARELLYTLHHTLVSRGVAGHVRMALTCDERDMLGDYCVVARHVIGGRGDVWYRVLAYGGSEWLLGAAPTNRGYYIVDPCIPTREPMQEMHISPRPIDPGLRFYTDPGFDDPPTTFFPIGDDDDPPPEYPVGTAHEAGRRNLNARPAWTLGRSVAGQMAGERLAARAQGVSEARIKWAGLQSRPRSER